MVNIMSVGLKGPVSKEGFENAVYMMDIGHNDMVGVAHTPSDGWDKKISAIIGEIRKAMGVDYTHSTFLEIVSLTNCIAQ
jgi:hypothetical protein